MNLLKILKQILHISSCIWSDYSKKYFKSSKKGFLNIHASLLPKWRGAAPIQRSIMNLDKETGISIMKINEN